MSNEKVILFDCMETLIELYELPGEKEYALWAYEDSGMEKTWNGFDEFLEHFCLIRRMLKEKYPHHKEYDIRQRYRLIIEEKMGREEQSISDILEKLIDNYWNRYKKNCFVKQDVVDVLGALAKIYRMGVVSNFIVIDGVEELLRDHRIDCFFDFVVTSVLEGWRKPHPVIYNAALKMAGVEAKNAIFIGDDFINDFLTPKKMGFKALLYDKKAIYPDIKERFTQFEDLPEQISRLL